MWVSEQIACQQISAHHRLFCPVNPWAMSKSEGTTLQQLAGKTKTGLRLTSAKAIFMKVLLELTRLMSLIENAVRSIPTVYRLLLRDRSSLLQDGRPPHP